MGMNHPGEIEPLAGIASPDVAIITNIGVAHIEHLGSREGIAQEKGMLAEALQPSGTLILLEGDALARSIVRGPRRTSFFAGSTAATFAPPMCGRIFTGMKFRLCVDQRSVEAELPVHGQHMVENALLAVAAGRVFGLSLEECAARLARDATHPRAAGARSSSAASRCSMTPTTPTRTR